MNLDDAISIERCKVLRPRDKFIRISVFIVQKANFNDEFLIETRWLEIEKLKNQPLEWLDLYLGKNPNSKKEIAFAYISGGKIIFLERDSDGVRAVLKNKYTHCYSDDCGERQIISAHIDSSSTRW